MAAENLVDAVDAVVLSGGSVYGLAAAHVAGADGALVGQDDGDAAADRGVLRLADGEAGHVGDQVAGAGACAHRLWVARAGDCCLW